MSNFSPIQKFKDLPNPQRTAVAVVGLLFLWLSGWFSIVSIGLGTWLLWNWWQKRSQKKSPQMFTAQTPQQTFPPNSASSSPVPPPSQMPPVPQPGFPNLSPPTQKRPSIDWRKKP